MTEEEKVEKDERDAWNRLDAFVEKHQKYKMTYSLEYSSIIDWVMDITPGRGHPKARQYGECWRRQSTRSRADAINRCIDQAEEELGP